MLKNSAQNLLVNVINIIGMLLLDLIKVPNFQMVQTLKAVYLLLSAHAEACSSATFKLRKIMFVMIHEASKI